MRFKIWLENIDRHVSQSIILNILGVNDDNEEQKNDVLSSLIKHHPDLIQAVEKTPELKTYYDKITGWIAGNENRTIQQLIDYIASVDDATPTSNHNQLNLNNNDDQSFI